MKYWQGRLDGDEASYHKIFQRISLTGDSENIRANDFVLHGFAVDEGVRRNKGRVGAKDAPNVIRQSMAGFPVFDPGFLLHDSGDVYCTDGNLENAQQHLAGAVSKVLSKGAKSVVLGGGHEVTFAHYSGIKNAFPGKKTGVINIDAHFDCREPEEGVGASSGTSFWQIATEGNNNCLYIGIQQNSNTRHLFNFVEQNGMPYILADEIFYENLPSLYQKVDAFAGSVDVLYVTICMDVFNAAIAPGVSAVAYNGIFADAAFMRLYRHILSNKKLLALDVAEVNPVYDIGDRTARLAAALINEWFMI